MTDTADNNPAPELPSELPSELRSEACPELRPELRAELRHWCEAWKTCLQNVLAQVSGQPAVFETSSASLPIADSDVWYTVVAGGAVRGEMALRLASAPGTRLALKFLGEAGPAADAIPPGPMTAEHKEALEELLRQVAGLAATALASGVGGEVQFHLAASGAPSWSSDALVCFETRDAGATATAVEIQISPALAAALQPRAESAPTAQASPAPPPTRSSTVSPPDASLRRLMDVGLDVKLRFGTRRMLLRDVLALSAGVVVELDNALHSPVDLLLDGRLIAQGEVVIVDGKYGLRVTDVVDHPSASGAAG
jgi:flagellar motor switch protein FliN